MDKSIETTWKEGFLKSDALVAPKINNLYNQKSKHIIDKFKRMFKINLVALIVFSLATLAYYFFSGMPYLGVFIFLLFNVYVIVGKKQLNSLKKIDKSTNSYQYLKSFDNWMKGIISYNTRIARFFYPLIFLAAAATLWLDPSESDTLRNITNDPSTYLVNDVEIFWLLGVIIVALLMAFLGEHIYKWDFKLVYGRVMKKLDKILADMEELRS